jgi:hypothetical protein
MPNYSEAKIYKLVCNKTGLVYYGSTCQPLYKRKFDHKIAYLSFLQGSNRHLKAFEIIKNDDYDIVLVEDIKCENKYQLEQRERYFIESEECVNLNYPIRTKEDKRESDKKRYYENIEKESLRKKQFYAENKEKVDLRNKKWREENKEKESLRTKQFYAENKEMINLTRKKWRTENKDKVIEQRKNEYRNRRIKTLYLNQLKYYNI